MSAQFAADFSLRATDERDIMRPPGLETRVSFRVMRYGLGLNAEGQQWWEIPGTFHTPQEVMEAIRKHLELLQTLPELSATEDEYVVLKSTTTVELWSEADE